MAKDLSAAEIEKAKFIFSIYDFDGKNEIDGVNLADCIRALDLTPSLKTISNFGGTQKKGEKKFTIEEFLTIFVEAKNDKDIGHLEDYIEVLRAFDKDKDGTMQINQLQHLLLNRGEVLDEKDLQFIIDDAQESPDEDGNIKYIPFMTQICKGPPSTFDDVAFSLTAPAPTPSRNSRKIRPSITVDDADIPSVSFAAAKPMLMPEAAEEEPQAQASFTLKAPRRSSSISVDAAASVSV